MKIGITTIAIGLIFAGAATAEMSPFWQNIREDMNQLSTDACDGHSPSAVLLEQKARTERNPVAKVSYAWLIANKKCEYFTGDQNDIFNLNLDAAKNGFPLGMSNTAMMMIRGSGTKHNPELAYEYIELAMDGGYPEAGAQYAKHLIEGKHIPQDLEEADYWLERAETEGARPALVTKVRKEYNAAAENNDSNQNPSTSSSAFAEQPNSSMAERLAQWRRGADFGCAQIGSQETVRQLALGGNTDAQVYVAWLYWKGDRCGIEEDVNESKKWTELAAQQGDAEAQLALGYFYNVGIKFELPEESVSDDEISLKSYENLGQDFEQAAVWTFKSANQGYVPALAVAARYLHQGIGVETNAQEAYELFYESGTRGLTAGYTGAAIVLYDRVMTDYIMKDTESFDETAGLSMELFILGDELDQQPPTDHLPHVAYFNKNFANQAIDTLNSWMSPAQKKKARQYADETLVSASE
jgi:TPR repeat protein